MMGHNMHFKVLKWNSLLNYPFYPFLSGSLMNIFNSQVQQMLQVLQMLKSVFEKVNLVVFVINSSKQN